MIVEFFATFSIVNVAPTLGSYTMIVQVIGYYGGLVPVGFRVEQERRNVRTFNMLGNFDSR